MENKQELLELLRRIESNQIKALESQAEHLSIAKAQIIKTESTINESVQLQRVAVKRQQQVRIVSFSLILFLFFYALYIGFKADLI